MTLNRLNSKLNLQQTNNLLLEHEAYRFAVGLFPHLKPFLPGHLRALVQFSMASKTERGNTVIVCFQTPAFTVPHLVGMCSHYRAVTDSAVLARQLAGRFKQLLVSVHFFFLLERLSLAICNHHTPSGWFLDP